MVVDEDELFSLGSQCQLCQLCISVSGQMLFNIPPFFDNFWMFLWQVFFQPVMCCYCIPVCVPIVIEKLFSNLNVIFCFEVDKSLAIHGLYMSSDVGARAATVVDEPSKRAVIFCGINSKNIKRSNILSLLFCWNIVNSLRTFHLPV